MEDTSGHSIARFTSSTMPACDTTRVIDIEPRVNHTIRIYVTRTLFELEPARMPEPYNRNLKKKRSSKVTRRDTNPLTKGIW